MTIDQLAEKCARVELSCDFEHIDAYVNYYHLCLDEAYRITTDKVFVSFEFNNLVEEYKEYLTKKGNIE